MYICVYILFVYKDSEFRLLKIVVDKMFSYKTHTAINEIRERHNNGKTLLF